MTPIPESKFNFHYTFERFNNYEIINRVRAISLDLLKRRLDKGLYKRLDIFQEDVFACLDRARRLSRTDSQIFEDSIELQSFFIRKRDEVGGEFNLCRFYLQRVYILLAVQRRSYFTCN